MHNIGDIIIYNDKVVLYKSTLDLIIYLVGSNDENELILNSVLNGLYDSISMLLRHQIEKRSILENLDMVLLALDETIDDGIILETDSTAIASRVSRPKADSSDIVINEQTIVSCSTVYERCTNKQLRRIDESFRHG